MINEEEFTKFLTTCPPSLVAYTNKDNNIFERAIFEHNLISLSIVYENINFETLTKFLKFDIEKVY